MKLTSYFAPAVTLRNTSLTSLFFPSLSMVKLSEASALFVKTALIFLCLPEPEPTTLNLTVLTLVLSPPSEV